MKKLIVVLIGVCLVTCSATAQLHELSAGFGMSYYFGDLNKSNNENNGPLAAISDNFNSRATHASYSLAYRYNFKKFLSAGLSYYFMNLSGNDAHSSSDPSKQDYGRYLRNLSFFTAVHLVTLDFRLEPLRNYQTFMKKEKWMFSPWISAGVGIFAFNPKTMYNGKEVALQPLGTEGQGFGNNPPRYDLTQWCVPFGLGLNVYNPSRKFSLGLNLKYNFTSTDYLDDVSTVYADPNWFNAYAPADAVLAKALYNRERTGPSPPGDKRGDPKDVDHFSTIQMTFSYYFNNPKISSCCSKSGLGK